MSYGRHDERTITIDDKFSISVWREKTRSGFRHLAVLKRGVCEVAHHKCCYLNRTWESYKYESVLHGLVRSYFPDADVPRILAVVDAGGREGSVGQKKDLAPFRAVSALGAAAGLLFGEDKEVEARAKLSAVKSIPGIDFPDDFDTLPVTTRLQRLDAVLSMCGNS